MILWISLIWILVNYLDKHGKEIFDYISNTIKVEAPSNDDSFYISIVFKIEFLDFFGLNELGMQKKKKKIYPDIKIDVKEILLLHKESISIIKKYLQNTMDGTIKRYTKST